MNVLVLLGGDSPEREVSLRSGKSVSEALISAGHNVSQYDPAKGYNGLDAFMEKVEIVLPILHGVGCEDGAIQLELELRNFKYLGADSKVSRFCFDKVAVKEKIAELGLKTPPYEVVDKEAYQKSELSKKPHVLKPIMGGSTIDTFIIRQHDLADGQEIDLGVFSRHGSMLLEELIEGSEITVPVLGDLALPVIEIIPPSGQDFDYENKYNGMTQELCPPKNIDEIQQKQAQEMSLKLHRACGIRHLSRTDIIISKNNEFFILENNTLPGMTSQSLFPKAANVAGISMPELVDRFVQMASE